MSKDTPAMGRMPAGAIDFATVQKNAKAGKEDIFEGAVSKVRDEAARLEAERGGKKKPAEEPAKPGGEG